jgi:hypothetical protein
LSFLSEKDEIITRNWLKEWAAENGIKALDGKEISESTEITISRSVLHYTEHKNMARLLNVSAENANKLCSFLKVVFTCLIWTYWFAVMTLEKPSVMHWIVARSLQLLQVSEDEKSKDALVSRCRAWASSNSVEFTESFDNFLNLSDSSAFVEMTKFLLAQDPFEWAEKLEEGDQAKALDLYYELHPVISEWLLPPCQCLTKSLIGSICMRNRVRLVDR